ncbi:OmpA/MotB family protein [Rhodocyclus purpureus]|uniref:OmpA/MotB family protein n=1 Tax=Rhodocyclus purpureus TaxID=1067 RepID=UPI001F5C913A|nr:OmpA family protein [Rhodocyclus purpureus]
MIGLLFIFIILIVVLALEQRRQQQEVEVERATLLGAGDPRGNVTKAIGDGVKLALPGVRVDRESGVISLPEEVLFDLGSAELTSAGKDALAGAASRLTQVLPCYVSNQRRGRNCPENRSGHEIETIFIEGHTDNRPMLRAGYDNTNLSLDRARAVERALVLGTPLREYRNKADQPLFSFSAYASSRPLRDSLPSDSRNRRVDLRIVLTYRPIEELLPMLAPAHGSSR